MSDKKFTLPKISLPKPDKETVKKASVSGAILAAVTVSCALLLSGTNTLLSALVGEENSPVVTDTAENSVENTVMPSTTEEVAVK